MTRMLAVAVGCVALAAIWLAPAAHAQADTCPNAGLRTGASAGLPDCRALELVSPPYKVGGTGAGVWYLGPASHGQVGMAGYDPAKERFAVQGTWGSVLTDSPFSFANDWALAERTATGWANKPAVTRGGYGAQWYRFMEPNAANEDLSLVAWGSNGTLRLFPEMENWDEGAADRPLFVRSWEPDAWELFGVTDPSQGEARSIALERSAVAEDGSYAVASGQVRGMGGPGDPTHRIWPEFVAGSGNVYLFDLSGGLTDAFPAPGDSRRSLVNVCSAGTVIPQRLPSEKLGSQGCPPVGEGRDAALISPRGGALGHPTEQSISRDGSRVFFMSPNPDEDSFQCTGVGAATSCPAQVYVRQRNVDGSVTTRWVSRSRSEANGDGGFDGAPIDQDASLMSRVLFEGASRDGSRVFFRTTAPLTPDDPNGACGAPCTTGEPDRDSSDLYMYELAGGPDGDPATADGDPGEGTLTRVSAGPTGGSDCQSPFTGSAIPREVGAARFVSADGGRVYFVCDVPLVGGPGATNGTITAPVPSPSFRNEFGVEVHTATNLYLYEAARPLAQRWRFVAHLPRDTSNSAMATCASTRPQTGAMLVGSIGRAVELTGHNCVRGSLDGSLLTFWTDGRLTGDDPDDATGDIYAYDAASDRLARVSRAAPDAADAEPYVCNVNSSRGPALCHGDSGVGGTDLPPLGVGGGVVFFESRSGLVAEDTDDGLYDVYQWRDGEVSLLSRWESESHAMYAGSDRSGRNVYVSTRDRLTWQDTDAVLDVYSVRVGGGIPAPEQPIFCNALAGGCHGPGVAAVGAAPSTEAPGGGNVVRGERARLALRGPSRAQRRRAARTGVVVLRVRVTRPGRVVAVARARLGKRVRRVGRGSRRLAGPGAVTLRVRLSRPARKRLRAGRALRVAVRAKTPGAVSRTTRFRLRRAGR